MKALTISQPFASLIASGEKWIENRSWPTNHRGPLAIHAGKGTQYLAREELAEYQTGCVIAVAKLAACVQMDVIRNNGQNAINRRLWIPCTNKTWADACDHQHAEGPWCWILEDVLLVEHVPIRGAQGLWDLNVSLRECV